MKAFNDLTDIEIRNLTEDEIAKYINLAKAEAGIKILPMPEQPTYASIALKDKTVYYSSLFGDSICSLKPSDITTLHEIVSKFNLYRHEYTSLGEGKYEYMLTPINLNNLNIQSVSAYSEKAFIDNKEKLLKNKLLESQYNKAISEYRNSVRKAEDVTSEIKTRIKSINERYDRIEELTNLFTNTYMPLAENNAKVAMAFLVKAYNLTDEDVEEVKRLTVTKAHTINAKSNTP
jgi:hypothetical protein